MKKTLIVLLVLMAVKGFAFDKSEFDIENKLLKTSGLQNQYYSYGNRFYQSEMSEISLISGGYFTIGTNKGFSSTEFDNCNTLTFGHPYAMTSFPFLNIDGTWGRFDELHPNLSDMTPQIQDDSLWIHFTHHEIIDVNFSMVSFNNGQNIRFNFTVKNNDTNIHQLGGGIVLDPALSRYGDGYIQNVTMPMNDPQSPISKPQFEIRENNGIAKGMKLGLLIDDPASTITIGNWETLYTTPFAEILETVLYDAAMHITWSGKDIAPGDSLVKTMTLELLEPDFGGNLFLRWDCPHQFILSNNVLFPQGVKTTVEIITSNQYFTTPNIDILLDNPYELYGNQEIYSTPLVGNRSFMPLTLNSREIYEDKIVKIRLIASDNGIVQDSLSRYVKIPATPVSDTGLNIQIDSLITSSYPDVQMIFSGEVEETGQKLLNLRPENVFLYENEERIENINLSKDSTGGVNAADIIFVLDVTGSMGNEISAVKSNINEFADSLSAKGINYQLGMVTFLDEIENVYPFTNNVVTFKTKISEQTAHGGGDGPENSLDALQQATEFEFRDNSKRIIIWITDERYHESDSVTPKTKNDIITSLLNTDITVHAIGTNNYKSEFYDPIINATGGNYYDINGNFRDILLDVSHLKTQDRFLLSYKSKTNSSQENTIRLEVHYAGLGGEATTEYMPPGFMPALSSFSCYPNPFNPDVTLDIQLNQSQDARVDIYNVLGQRIKHFDLSHSNTNRLIWNATNDMDLPVSGGMYIVRLSHRQQNGEIKHETQKILYLK